MKLKIKVLSGGIPPKQMTDGSGGIDLSITNDIVIDTHETVMAPLGIQVSIPIGWVGLIVPRSSYGLKGLKLANTVGVIDSDYRGEVMLPLKTETNGRMVIPKGTRVAQMVIVPHLTTELEIVEELEKTGRGHGKFGSTGK